ncbi:hypothetical protein HPT27_11735 [Permianibacter sp. IMCC34836]|uniref:PilC/PilY family type IV pilus protein n=1 Tax=Permianibacter fluminis TaxID=2738515 RepID=UPI00155209A3|nr:PilC/PilY family type IV pilus protein [Permianibacter fluminis]NQD37697.1 hypothetical protein [Permianibacter fluminis]
MYAKCFKQAAVASLSMAYMLASTAALAEDTEIFFNAAYNVETQPNILFVIDTSGSMGDAPSSGGSLSKLVIVKNAMNQLLSEVQDVNVGLARYTVPGGPIVYPVTDIDAPADPRVSVRVSASADDAEEASSGAVNISDADLDMMEDTGSAKWIGVRFNMLDIPQGAQIVGASLGMEASQTNSGTMTVRVYGQKVASAPAFAATANNISSRAMTTASVTWSPVNFATVGDQYVTTDISSIIQEIVNQSTWCGGNSIVLMIRREGSGTNLRAGYSYDGDATQAPMLRVQYDGTLPSGANGCYTKLATSKVLVDTDDVGQNWSGVVSSNSSTLSLRTSNDRAIGIRFPGLAVPKDADVTEAYVEFTAASNSTTTDTVAKVEGVAQDNFVAFGTANNSLTTTTIPPGVPKTTATQNVTFRNWVNGQVTPQHPENLKNIVKEITSRAGWVSGNALGMVLTYVSGDRKHAKAYSSSSGPRLYVRYKTVFSTGDYTVRDEMKRSVNELVANGYTPISDTLLEAGLYYRGNNVLYGKTRNGSAKNLISHPDSYTGGTHSVPTGCDPVLDPFNTLCKDEKINGTPVYRSPITDSCQKSHIVFLTDGLPTWHAPTTSTTFASWPSAGTCIAGTGQAGETQTGRNGDDCTVKIAGYLHNRDQSGLPATQTVNSHFIGFDVDAPFLETAADAGGGGYYQASNADLVLDAFRQIVNNILQSNGSFVSAGVTTSQSNRLRHEDQLYFSVFGPTLKPRWPGNVKRYQLVGDELRDVNGNSAINSLSDQFLDTAQSWWSPGIDGNKPGEGGAASQLSNSRTIYSNIVGDSNVLLIQSGNSVADGNSSITQAMLGASSSTERTALLKWARGTDVDDVDGDTSTTDAHHLFGDPLHSRPTLLRYKTSGGTEFLRVFVGTNTGTLSALNPDTGAETWAFMPKELLGHIKTLRDNVEGQQKPYGVDGSIVPFFEDLNGDGVINVGTESAYLVVGMRRGGDHYYVLDISNPAAPRLKYIMGRDLPSVGSYPKLAQTWSAPVIGKIKWGGVSKLVMIFGAGYDVTQDVNGAPLDDGVGNAVYIADAATGEQLWSSDALGLTTMTNSIPADVAAIDLNNDGFIDHVYATDTRAQVFRFDLSTSGTITGGRMAHLQTGVDQASNRRFFARVDVALVERPGDDYLAVTVGSGFRERPLDVTINDYFYAIRDFGAFTSTIPTDVTMSDLVDITDIVGDADGDGDNLDALEAIDTADKKGWYYDFGTDGEKVLAQATILNGIVYVGTYLPPDSSSGSVDCSGGTGSSRLYAFSLTDGNPIKDVDGNNLVDGSDRYINIANCATCGFVPLQLLVGERDIVGLLGTSVISGFDFANAKERVKRVKWQAQ